jgi:hypothetical protein
MTSMGMTLKEVPRVHAGPSCLRIVGGVLRVNLPSDQTISPLVKYVSPSSTICE